MKLQGRERNEDKSFVRKNGLFFFFCFLNLSVGGGDSEAGTSCATVTPAAEWGYTEAGHSS